KRASPVPPVPSKREVAPIQTKRGDEKDAAAAWAEIRNFIPTPVIQSKSEIPFGAPVSQSERTKLSPYEVEALSDKENTPAPSDDARAPSRARSSRLSLLFLFATGMIATLLALVVATIPSWWKSEPRIAVGTSKTSERPSSSELRMQREARSGGTPTAEK